MSGRSCIMLVAALTLAWWVAADSGVAADDAADIESQIAKLMVERRDTLRQRAEAVKAMHKSGNMSLEQVVAAENELLASELELVSSKPERIQLCQKQLDNLRLLEQIVVQRYSAGRASIEKKLMVTAARLQAEIDCLREQASSK